MLLGASGTVAVGGTNGVSGVALASSEFGPFPTLLVARTRKSYSVPSVKLVTVTLVGSGGA